MTPMSVNGPIKTESSKLSVGWLKFNIPFQHKYGYIRD